MSWERAGRLAWIAPPLTVAFVAAFYLIADYPDKGSEGVEVFFVLTFLTYAVVGALVASRRPRNPVGWLFCASGSTSRASEALYAYARDPRDRRAWWPPRGCIVDGASPPPWPSCCSSCCSRRGISCPAAGGSPASARSWPRPSGPWRSRSIPVRCARSTADPNPLGIDGAGAVLDPIAGFGPSSVGVILLAVARRRCPVPPGARARAPAAQVARARRRVPGRGAARDRLFSSLVDTDRACGTSSRRCSSARASPRSRSPRRSRSCASGSTTSTSSSTARWSTAR